MTRPRHKILFVTPGLRQGGAERQLLELIRRLPERFEPVLCLFEAEEMHYRDFLPPGQPRHVIGSRRMGPSGLRRLAQVIEREQPAILHSYRDRANLWTRVAMQLFGVRVPILITSVRNRGIDPLNLLTESTFADFTDRVLSNSVGVQNELRSWARVPESKLQVIPNFVDFESFRPPRPGEREAARERFEVSPSHRVLVLPGRISMQKHQLGLLGALQILRRSGRLPDHVRILLAGRERDRTYSRLVRSLVTRWRLQDHVRLLGPISDVLAVYHAADAAILPSLYEGMPNAVIEAQACGLPVLVSRAANADGLVRSGDTGIEVPTANRRVLAEGLDQLFRASEAQLSAMGAKARTSVSAALDNDLLLGAFTSLYDDLLASHGLAAAPDDASMPVAREMHSST
jgi:glycosyltransferase involved in cell wall biosynthesis